MYYISWDLGSEIDGWKELNLNRLLTEVDEQGKVLKELGINKQGEIVHAFPDKNYKYGDYGMWDNVKVEPYFLRDDLSKIEFYNLWVKR